MIAVKEKLKCKNCDGLLEDAGDHDDKDGHRIICVNCGREHDSEGKLLPHPIGGRIKERTDGGADGSYGPRFA